MYQLSKERKNLIPFSFIFLLTILILVSCSQQEVQEDISEINTPMVEVTPTANPTSTTVQVDKPSPSPVPTDIPTPTPEITFFSLDYASTSPPDDIIQHLTWSGGMGGSSPPCEGSYPNPGIEFAPEEIELFETMFVRSCGWRKGEIVEVSIYKPGGIVDEIQESAEFGYIELRFVPELDAPTGKYTVEFSGSSGRTDTKVRVNSLDDPRFFIIPENKEIILWGFKPNEVIRLIAYQDIGGYNFYAWQEFAVDQSGYLEIDVDLDENEQYFPYFVAIGEESGQVDYRHKGWGGLFRVGIGYLGEIYCEGAPPIIEGINNRVKVRVVSPDAFVKISINDQEGVRYPIKEGTVLEVFDNPQCEDQMFWWHVSKSDVCTQISEISCDEYFGVSIPEGNAEEYFIEVLE